jgi:hypothetical protein
MIHLQQLTPCLYLPNEQRDQLDMLKSDLIHSLDRQINQVEAQLNDGVFLDMVRAWLRCEDEDVSMPADRFYWQHRSGAWIITLTEDGHVVPITDSMPSIEVGYADDIPKCLDTLKQAIKAGELDEQLKSIMQNSSNRPAP